MHTSRECEVNCIVALVKESKHDLPGALAAYKACLDTKSVTDLEYNIARFAMQRLRGPQSQTSEGNSAGDRSTSNRL